jgi:hypothetical protein
MKFKGIGSVSMGGQFGEVGGKIDDLDGFEGAFLDAKTATDAKCFGNGADFGSGSHFDAELAGLVDGTALFTLLFAFLGFTFIFVDYSDSYSVVHFL